MQTDAARSPGLSRNRAANLPGPSAETYCSGRWFVFTWLLFFASTAFGEVRLPLQGYYRVGRFFPVLVDGTDASGGTRLSAGECLDCDVEPTTASSLIVPMLAIGEPHALSNGHLPIALNSLAENERLVASTTAELPADLFPQCKVIAVHLDPADLLPGPPAAWESLDAIVLDAPSFSRITDSQRSSLLAGGVSLIATGQKPDDRWPWQQRDMVWRLDGNALGPGNQSIDEATYSPTFGWVPGWSAGMRGQVMGIATLITLLTCGILLAKTNRWTAAFSIAVPLLATGGIVIWRQSLASVERAGGDILIASNGLVQRDSWVYQRARTDSIQTVPWAGWTRPMFGSNRGVDEAAPRIQVKPDGTLSFSYHAIAGHTMAFVRREIQPGSSPATSPAQDSPMQELAKSVYLKAGYKIAGQVTGSAARWPGVLLSK